LKIRQIVHIRGHPYHFPTYIRVRAAMSECGEGQTDTQPAVTSIHFASATPHAKCNDGLDAPTSVDVGSDDRNHRRRLTSMMTAAAGRRRDDDRWTSPRSH